ncbi:S41 family peptidase [Desulfovibrio litoralis]|uniref:C-terminal processing peptidase-3. Serine peptidase. MEROPS family S41A n=1 Tax=Desulfovibrio litoralis DSM 11393 TaxID=1121455 RepID=A0A1M7RUQ7_9BACT|nr:S41 family peptidase [Desulfovibrio litoralis]SHN49993.1 C-terminal processing peptidase-3. Serine peptidase. MEROPS family S41A [Desulfovibrio litoralis DSM 11393]
MHLRGKLKTLGKLTIFIVLITFATGALAENYDPLKRFTKVLELIKRNYVTEVTFDEIIDGAIKGMLQNLDPHSTFLTPEEYKETKENISSEFFGVGIELSTENGQVIVISPIEDTPAYKGGIKSGDLILSVDGTPTKNLSPQEVVSKIRGPKDTKVELLILHKDAKAPETIVLTRSSIPLVSVKSKEIEDGYYWLRLTRFSERTVDDLNNAIKEAAKKGPIKGIVLDLRNNPGGLLDQAVEVSDVFLRSGDIVSIKGRAGSSSSSFKAKNKTSDIDVPLVVLINAGSASASEIVAGALQDQNRALLVGERSFGKGSVQSIINLPDDSAIKLTVALYYTPSGRSIQAEGIEPDMEIPFELGTTGETDKLGFSIREQDLSKHLENGNIKDKKDNKPSDKKDNKDKKDIPLDVLKNKDVKSRSANINPDILPQYEKDNQLRMAYELLKAIPRVKEIKEYQNVKENNENKENQNIERPY